MFRSCFRLFVFPVLGKRVLKHLVLIFEVCLVFIKSQLCDIMHSPAGYVIDVDLPAEISFSLFFQLV